MVVKCLPLSSKCCLALTLLIFGSLFAQTGKIIASGDYQSSWQATVAGDHLYYFRNAESPSLVRSNLDGSNRTQVAAIHGIGGLASLNEKVYFVSFKQRTWNVPVTYSFNVSDGTTEGTYELSGMPADAQTMQQATYIVANRRLYFIYRFTSSSPQLWSTDGTMGGAHLLKQFAKFGNPEFTQAGSNLFFTAVDGAHGLQLWAINLTTEQPILVSDAKPYGESSPRNLQVLNNKVFFQR